MRSFVYDAAVLVAADRSERRVWAEHKARLELGAVPLVPAPVVAQVSRSGMSHWDGPAVAERLNASVHAVWRVLRREGIYLQRRRSWCVSTDKEFAPKAAEVVGLYLNPPLNAVVLSVDEKPTIQAIERASGYVETDSGKVVRALKSTYKRHGTLNLFAALEVGTGQVHTKFTEYKKREDFRSFLDGVLADQPQDKEIHVILDNYSTHKRNDDWLAKFEGRVQFHFTPTSASWLNQIEIVFSLLQRKTLNGGSFKTKDQLREAIEAFLRRAQRACQTVPLAQARSQGQPAPEYNCQFTQLSTSRRGWGGRGWIFQAAETEPNRVYKSMTITVFRVHRTYSCRE